MLFVFHVDGGRMLRLDVGLVTGPVRGLQMAIEELTTIPAQNQALLISGGEILDSTKSVSHYQGAGTDSNPIFLTNKHITELSTKSLEDTQELSDELSSVEEQILSIRGAHPSFESIQTLAQHARSCCDLSDRAFELCKKLVEEQHFLHQGWSALVANLEDAVRTFSRRADKFRVHFKRFLMTKEKARELLSSFQDDINLLAQIPLPLCLISEELKRQFSDTNDTRSLLDWIAVSDPDHSLEDVAREVRAHLQQIEDVEWSELERDVEMVQEQAGLEEYKEVKGISKRLGQLDEYLYKAEKMLVDQRKLADNLVQMEQKALTLTRDTNVLRDLKNTQLTQLEIMVNSLKQLVEISSKFQDSKYELLENVRRRLSGWIQETHRSLYSANSKVVINGERLSDLRKRLEVLRQLHETPTIYAAAISEVLRRKSFAADFVSWASQLAAKSQMLREEEVELRTNFAKKIEKHFLRSLFPGMNDPAPDFATQLPPYFDHNLPSVEAEHLRALRQAAPSLAGLLQVKKSDVHNRMLVDDSRGMSGMRREASFFCTSTPPKYTVVARSFPSSTWLSGDENLEMSPSFGGQTPPSAHYSKIEFARLGGFDSPSPLAEDVSCVPELIGTTADATQGQNSARSAPIRIPSRAPSDGMSTSRGQLSGKSSHFGTPDEDFPTSSGDMGPSPPELISKSELKEEIHRLASEIHTKVSGISDPTIDSLAETDDGLMFNASATTSQLTIRKTSDISLEEEYGRLQNLLSSKDNKIKEIETSLEESRQREQALKTECQNVKENYSKMKENLNIKTQSLTWSVRELREELESIRKAFEACGSESKASMSELILTLTSSCGNVEEKLRKDFADTQQTSLSELRSEYEAKIEDVMRKMELEESKLKDAECEIGNYQEVLQQKSAALSGVEEERKEREEEWKNKLNESNHEIYKQLTIEHELQLHDFRERCKHELQEKDGEIEQLKDDLSEKQAVLKQQRKETDQLVASICERELPSPSPPSYDNSMLQEKLGQKRAELEKEFRDKLQFLTKGMEEKKNEALERAQAEKRVELRMLKEAQDAELKTVNENFVSETGRLRKELDECMAKIKEQDSVDQTKTRSHSVTQTDPVADVETGERSCNSETANAKEESSGDFVPAESEGGSQTEEQVPTSQTEEETNLTALKDIMSGSMMTVPQPEHLMEDGDRSPTGAEGEGAEEEEVKGEKKIQTELRMKHLKGMISVVELREGDAVLLVWDPIYTSYLVFNTGPTLHFLKESSAKKMALLGSNPPQTRKNWSLAQLTKKAEYCQIKKEKNRYNLPMQAKFYRVEAERLEPKHYLTSGGAKHVPSSNVTVLPQIRELPLCIPAESRTE